MGQAALPLGSGGLLWRTIEVGHSDGRAMDAQAFAEDPVASAGANHMHRDFGILKNPCPLGAPAHPCVGLITVDQSATPQARQDLRHSMIPTCFHPPEEIRQSPFAAGHPIDLRKERGQALVTNGLGMA
jgi:hypothetical protein